MIRIYLIRHLKTKGNYERRYIGRTDEGLYEADKQVFAGGLAGIQAVYASPMRRCTQTAKLLAPGFTPILEEGLKEIDFGDFEYKCYEELKDNPDYIRFIDSGGTGGIPNGEDAKAFKDRCCGAFMKITGSLLDSGNTVILVVCHGGTIMSILERFQEQGRSFYDYQVKNGFGYEAEFDPGTNKIKRIKELIE